MARIGLNGRGIGHQVDEPELRVGRGRRPGGHVARPAPGVVIPGLMAELSRSGDDVELPQHFAGTGVDTHDVPRHVLYAGLVVARLMPYQHDDHAVDHDRGRRRGDHPELLGNAMARVIRAVPSQPRTPVGHQRRNEVDYPVRGKGIYADRLAPALQRSPGLGVQRPEKERRRGDVDDAPAVDLRVGDPLAEVAARRAKVTHRLRLAKGPERFAGGGVNGHHLPPLAGHGVEHAIGKYRGGPRRVLDPGPEVVSAPDPGDLQVGKVAGVDLREPGVGAGVAGVSTEVAPLAALNPRKLRGGRGSHAEQAGDGRQDAAGHTVTLHRAPPDSRRL